MLVKWPLILYRTSVPITKGSRRRRCNGDAPDPRGKRYFCICGLWPESQRPVDWCLYHPIHLLQECLGCGECEADPLPKIDAHCAIPQQGWKHCWPFRHRTSFRLRGNGSSDQEGISGRAGHSSSRVEDWERFGSICIGLIFPRLGSQAAVMEGLCHQQPGGWKEFVDAKDRSCHGRWRGFVGGALSHHRRCPRCSSHGPYRTHEIQDCPKPWVLGRLRLAPERLVACDLSTLPGGAVAWRSTKSPEVQKRQDCWDHQGSGFYQIHWPRGVLFLNPHDSNQFQVPNWEATTAIEYIDISVSISIGYE